MLSEMPRQILRGDVELEKLFNMLIMQIESGITEMPLGCVIRILPFKCPDQTREPGDSFLIKPHHLSHLACRRTAAIGDDICGHCRSVLTITLIYILNRLLALIPTGQIEIDVRPFAPFFR